MGSYRLVTGAALAALFFMVSAARGDSAAVLKELGFPAGTIEQIRAGKMVKTDLKSSNERELAIGLAFLVKEKPGELADEVMHGLLTSVDPDVEAHGALSGEGTLDQLSGLSLGDLTDAYRKAKAGGSLNLSKAEIAALQALKGKPAPAIEQEVYQQLLARYRAYRGKGLDGIAPYARSGGERSGAADLRSATRAASAVKSVAPDYYDTLLGYPKKPASGFREMYSWQRYKAHGEPTVILSHGFTMQDGESYHALQRQFYVSSSYNVEQAMAGFLPIPEGTLVVYVGRTSTDQVAGFGGGTKRSMGKKIMATQLEGLYQKFSKAAEAR